MTATRGAALAGGTALLAAWLAAAAGTRSTGPGPAVDTGGADAGAQDPLVGEIHAQGERLRERLRDRPVPIPARNPFEFGPKVAPQPATIQAPVAAQAVEPEPQPVAFRPSLTLAGVAEHRTAEGAQRTAIISGLNQLFLVKEGESFAGRFTVAAIGADVVELIDGQDGSRVRLALK